MIKIKRGARGRETREGESRPSRVSLSRARGSRAPYLPMQYSSMQVYSMYLQFWRQCWFELIHAHLISDAKTFTSD